MYRYKLMLKQHWFLALLIVMGVLSLVLWTDAIIHIINITKDVSHG